MAKLTQREIKSLIKEEAKSAKMYRGFNLPTIARDEARHKRILLSKLKASK